jgi:hypothetical protein
MQHHTRCERIRRITANLSEPAATRSNLKPVCRLTEDAEKDRLLKNYWAAPDRQIEESSCS